MINPRNQSPVPQYQWREAEDRAAKYWHSLELHKELVSQLQDRAALFMISPDDPERFEELLEVVGRERYERLKKWVSEKPRDTKR